MRMRVGMLAHTQHVVPSGHSLGRTVVFTGIATHLGDESRRHLYSFSRRTCRSSAWDRQEDAARLKSGFGKLMVSSSSQKFASVRIKILEAHALPPTPPLQSPSRSAQRPFFRLATSFACRRGTSQVRPVRSPPSACFHLGRRR